MLRIDHNKSYRSKEFRSHSTTSCRETAQIFRLKVDSGLRRSANDNSIRSCKTNSIQIYKCFCSFIKNTHMPAAPFLLYLSLQIYQIHGSVQQRAL